ncbi:tape measure protein [Fannyhessea vaginae]|uniref:tape measure protein n=1 Tax=Fannyhessea vaginae TaxID=82135 RepID=UPI003A7FAD37
MAEVGSAYLTIIPKFKSLKASIDDALSAAGSNAGTSVGERIGSNISRGIKRGESTVKRSALVMGAAMGAFSSIAQRAMDVLQEHIGSAVNRLDTLKNYPRVMQSLGFSSQEASSSITKMSDRLQTLPTRLDDMTNTVKGIAVITKDLDLATDAGLALNDMLLASGSNQMICNAAMEQFRQMLSKGKPDMQDWKSLMQAMPGQIDQLAKSMLGANATANDLYEALGGGGKKATISMDQLLHAMIKLDKDGGGSLTSFQAQAAEATGGINTSMSNLSNAFTKGLTSIMDAIGQKNIAGFLNSLKAAVDFTFRGIADVVKFVAPVFSTLAQSIAAGAASFGLLLGAPIIVDAVINAVKGLKTAIMALSTAHPIILAISLAVAALTPIVTNMWNSWQESQKMVKATNDFKNAISSTTALASYSGGIRAIGEAADTASSRVESIRERTERYTKAINQNVEEAQKTVGTYNEAAGIISEYTGKTELNAEAQGKVMWAVRELNKALGTNITAQDVMNGKYTDANGKIHELKSSILDLIETKKKEAILEANAKNISELYSKRAEDVKAAASAQQAYNEALARAAEAQAAFDKDYNTRKDWGLRNKWSEAQKAVEDCKKSLDEANGALDNDNSAIQEVNKSMGEMSTQAGFLSQVLEGMGAKSHLDELQINIKNVSQALADAGVHSSELERIGRDGFNNLADSCKGNIAQMVAAIKNFDNTPIKNKKGEVIADSTSLVDAQGKLYVWNGTKLIDKETQATADTTEVVDGTGHILEWDGTNLDTKDATATVDSDSVQEATDRNNEYNNTPPEDASASEDVDSDSVQEATDRNNELNSNPPEDQHATITIDHVVNNIVNWFENVLGDNGHGMHAAGGIRTHADGGVRMHAEGGAIATRAMPLDIVGEDGAEAIVPLTNRKYSQPFADIIAEGVAEKLDNKENIAHLEAIERLLVQLTQKDANVYLDSSKVSSALVSCARASMEGRGYVY